jgi:hypothetical protein
MVCAARTKFRSQSVCSAEVLVNAETVHVDLQVYDYATYQDLTRAEGQPSLVLRLFGG